MGRKKKPEIVQLHLRADRELLDALDAFAKEERKKRPGEYVSRANIARSILYKAITAPKEA